MYAETLSTLIKELLVKWPVQMWIDCTGYVIYYNSRYFSYLGSSSELLKFQRKRNIKVHFSAEYSTKRALV